jgi:hypothetical protein
MGRELAGEGDRAAAGVRSTQAYRGPGAAEKVVVPARVWSSGRSKAQRDDVETTAHAAGRAWDRADDRRSAGLAPLRLRCENEPHAVAVL